MSGGGWGLTCGSATYCELWMRLPVKLAKPGKSGREGLEKNPEATMTCREAAVARAEAGAA